MPTEYQIDSSFLVDSPRYWAERLLGRRFSSETHYRAYRRHPALYHSLRGGNSLQNAGIALLPALLVVAMLYYFQVFFEDTATGDAAENQSFGDTLVVVSFTFLALIGYIIQNYVGYESYRDPERFKRYFEELKEEVGDAECYRVWLNPNPQNEGEYQQFLQFHTGVYQYLLNTDERAAAYMLNNFSLHFPYFYQPRYAEIRQVSGEATDAVARQLENTIEEDDERRRRITRRLVAIQLGVIQSPADGVFGPELDQQIDRELDAKLDAIWQRAQQIIEEQGAVAPREPIITAYQRRGIEPGRRANQAVGEEIGRLHRELLTARETMSRDDPRWLAALSEAMTRENSRFFLTPVSLDIFRNRGLGRTPATSPAALFAAARDASADPLNLNLVDGERNVSLLLVEGSSVLHQRKDIEGFHAQNVSDDQRQQARQSGLREQCRHPDYRQDFQRGAISVLLASRAYDHVRHGTQRAHHKIATWLRRFIGHKDPLELFSGSIDMESRLRNRAHVLAHLLRPPKHYGRWQHWIAHDQSNTQAFLSLSVEHQVWVIFTLLSGAPYAQFTALSLIEDPHFTLDHYNRFMRAYIVFMRRYIHQEEVPPFIADTRCMLFVKQLQGLTDLSAPRTAQFLQQHVQKPTQIMHALLHTFTESCLNSHSARVRIFLGEGPEFVLSWERLRDLAESLKQHTVSTREQYDLSHLAAADPPLKAKIVEDTVRRDVWLSCCLLMTHLEARQHARALYEYLPAVPRFAFMQAVNELLPVNHSQIFSDALEQVQMCVQAGYLQDRLQPGQQQQLMTLADRERLAAAATHLLRCLITESLQPNMQLRLLEHVEQLINRADVLFEISYFMAALLDAALTLQQDVTLSATAAVIWTRLFYGYRRLMQREVPIGYPAQQGPDAAYSLYLALYQGPPPYAERLLHDHWTFFRGSCLLLHHPQLFYLGHHAENQSLKNIIVVVQQALSGCEQEMALGRKIMIIAPAVDVLSHCLFYYDNPISRDGNRRGYPKIIDVPALTWLDLLEQILKNLTVCGETELAELRERLKRLCAQVVHILLSPNLLFAGVFKRFSNNMPQISELCVGDLNHLFNLLPDGLKNIRETSNQCVLERLFMASCYRRWRCSPGVSWLNCWPRQRVAERNRDDARYVQQSMRGIGFQINARFFLLLGVEDGFSQWFRARWDQDTRHAEDVQFSEELTPLLERN